MLLELSLKCSYVGRLVRCVGQRSAETVRLADLEADRSQLAEQLEVQRKDLGAKRFVFGVVFRPFFESFP